MLALIPRSGEGLWRGHANQGRDSLADVPFWRKPTERLTELNSTPDAAFSQAEF
jgi:hypothetical protein